MIKNYFSLLFGLFSLCTFAQQALITGYVDATCPGAEGRVLEIYVDGTVDFTGWQLARQANGKGYSTSIDISELGTMTDGFAYIVNNASTFTSEFNLTGPVIENNIISSNGDDGFQLVDATAVVEDRFGEDGVDGTGTPWEHENSYFTRKNGATANSGAFNPSNWTFAALNALNDKGTCNGGASFGSIVPLGTYSANAAVADPIVQFDEDYISIDENAGTATLTVSLSESPTTDATVNVDVLSAESSAKPDTDYSFAGETLTFTPTGPLSQQITLDILDNDKPNPDLLLALQLTTGTNATIGKKEISVIYILDDEAHAPSAPNTLGMAFGASYKIPGDDPGSEIVAHDPKTQRLFVMNSGSARIEILDFSDPLNLTLIKSVDLSEYGSGGTSVAVYNGLVAATAVPDEVGKNGAIVFMDTEGTIINAVNVGALPDMITYNLDGTKLLVANEGEPNQDYTVDPEGSISIIDLSAGAEALTQDDVVNLDFNAYDSKIDALRSAGIRIFGPNASVSQDLEPEYITVSDNNNTAWVTLQENNAVAVIDLTAMEISDIFPLGYKDHSLPKNALDTSNKTDFAFMANWPIFGMYLPDGIANYTVDGVEYFVTANEGDAREYDAFAEETDLEDITLNPVNFPNQEFLVRDENLGKLSFSKMDGDLDGNGDYEELYAYGGRSFSIYNGSTGAQVYDSGDDFERITLEDPTYGAIFNTTNDENERKNRSDNKGPEPETVIVKKIGARFYAFIGLERIGGIMVYDITDPLSPTFEGYFNNRSTAPGEDVTGDLAPEGIIYVAPADNAAAKGLIVVANEVSATISVYTLDNNTLSVKENSLVDNSLKLYPNPASGNRVFFGRPSDYELFDMRGRKLREQDKATYIDVSDLSTGTYIVKNAIGISQKLIVQ